MIGVCKNDTKFHLDDIASRYPGLTVLDYPTYAYNDIAHAWYGSTSYWMDPFSFDNFKSDIHTDGPYNISVAQPNDIITYWNSDYTMCYHSGIVVDVESDGMVVCESKWDEYGLYIHDYNYVPNDYGNYDATTGRFYLNVHIYRYTQDEHDLYMYADYGESGCVVKCNTSKNNETCTYTIVCDEAPEYDPSGDSGHYISCPSGEFTILEEHSGLITPITGNLYYHNGYCTECYYSYTEAHTWQAVSGGYRCADCGMTSANIPGIMSLTDEELQALLAELSEDELAAFIAGLDPEARNRVTSILTPPDDNLVTE